MTCEVRLNVFLMIDFSKKFRRIVCILARWDVRLRFTVPSRDTSEVRGACWKLLTMSALFRLGSRDIILCQTRPSQTENSVLDSIMIT